MREREIVLKDLDSPELTQLQRWLTPKKERERGVIWSDVFLEEIERK